MDAHTHIPLKNFTTMKLGGPARVFIEIKSPQEIPPLYDYAAQNNLSIFILGGGSNLIGRDEGYNGIVAHIRLPGFSVLEDTPGSTTIKIGAGENWDDTVKRTVEMNLSGIEAMSGIPGTAGATPVQNVGAYGQEIADTLVSLEAYDTATKSFVTLTSDQCGFSYRDSIFRNSEKNRYVIITITLTLSKNNPTPPFYAALQKSLDERAVTLYTPEIIRDTVLAIRKEKLPSVEDKASAGSFFKNAVIPDWQFQQFIAKYPDAPNFDMGNGSHKIPTGWLIDQAGLKGQLLHGFRVYDKNALVLVNESATGYADLQAAREEIQGKIRDTFQVLIEQEPLEIE